MFEKIICLKNGDTLKLREAQEKDGALVVDFMNEVAGESDNLSFGKDEFYSNVEQEQIFLESTRKDKKSLFLLAEIDGELVAQGSLNANKRKRMKHRASFGITVKKKFWNIGIADSMLNTFLEFAQNTGVLSVISLEVRSDNIHAIHLYEKYGFKKVGIHRNFMRIDDSYYDVDLMELYK